MKPRGQSFLRKAMRALGLVSPEQLSSSRLFAIAMGSPHIPSVPIHAFDDYDAYPEDEKEKTLYAKRDGVAILPIVGPVSKHPDIFRLLGCGSRPTLPELTQAVQRAQADPDVRGLMLAIDSPGGTVEGTHELAEAVYAAAQEMPVHTYIQDRGESAAYWIGSQADRVTVNAVGAAGSIGVFSILVDSSRAAEKAGLRFHRIATGEHKGAGADGVPITEDQLSAWQDRVEAVGSVFFAGVARGRGMEIDQVRQLADGRSWTGQASVRLGLTDAVGSCDQALQAITREIRNPTPAPSPSSEESPAATSASTNRPPKGQRRNRDMSALNQILRALRAQEDQEVEAEWETLSGTVSVEAETTSVTGTGTMFTDEVASEDQVRIADEEHVVASVESDTALTLVSGHAAGATDVPIERLVPQETPDEEEEPEEEPAPPPPPPADDENAFDRAVDQALTRKLAPMLADQALERFADSVPPAELREARKLLVRAARDGRMDDFKSTVRMLGNRTGVSPLLGSHVGSGRKTGSARTVPRMSAEDVRWLESVGITPEQATRAVRKYMQPKA